MGRANLPRALLGEENMGDNDLHLIEVLERWFRAAEWLVIRAALLLLLMYELIKFVAGHA